MTSKTTTPPITDRNSDTRCAKSIPSDSDSESLDLEDVDLDTMSTSQFLLLPRGGDSSVLDLGSLETILSDEEEEDEYLTPKSSVHLSSSLSSISSHSREGSVPTITVITPETEISYARESYSPSSISHLLPPHFKERQFVNVFEGDALVVLEELTEFLWIVKVCRTQMIGMIPAWNVEGELERLARINMVFNGRVSSPVAEFASPLSSPSSFSSESEGTSSSAPHSPTSIDDRTSALVVTMESLYVSDESKFYQSTKVRQVHGPKSVGFVSTRPQSIYRYPSETYIHGEWDELDPERHHIAISAKWSHGWLEGDEEDCISEDFMANLADVPADKKRKARRGRKRNKKRMSVI